MSGLKPDDAGTFTCLAKNTFGEAKTSVILHKIDKNGENNGKNINEVGEKTIDRYTEIGIMMHSDAYLTCRHTFNTKDYTWKLPNGKLHTKNSWRYSMIGRGTLRIRAVQQRHSGMYREC